MSTGFAIAVLVVASLWVVAVAAGMVAIHRRGLERSLSSLAPGVDLAGTWFGAASIGLLAYGRLGFTMLWAGAMFACAMGVTAGLYDRAVLVPSLRAALKRLRADPDNPKWASDWAFLARLGAGTRFATLVCAAAAIACVSLIPW